MQTMLAVAPSPLYNYRAHVTKLRHVTVLPARQDSRRLSAVSESPWEALRYATVLQQTVLTASSKH